MNHREPRPTPRESLHAVHFVALLLLPVLDPSNAYATGRSRNSTQFRTPVRESSVPYLVAIGPPPLRFQEYTPPPDLSTRPSAGAPPNPSGNSSSTATPLPDVIVPATETSSLPPPPASKNESKDAPSAPKKPGPQAIIPDDTRPTVRPEDFLPFFQIPGSPQGPTEVNNSAPVPRAIPPSSATYTQTPR